MSGQDEASFWKSLFVAVNMNEIMMLLMLFAAMLFALWCISCVMSHLKATGQRRALLVAAASRHHDDINGRLEQAANAVYRVNASNAVGPAIHNLSSSAADSTVTGEHDPQHWVGLSAAAASAGVTERELLRYILASAAQANIGGGNAGHNAYGAPLAGPASTASQQRHAACPRVRSRVSGLVGDGAIAAALGVETADVERGVLPGAPHARHRRLGEATEICHSLLTNLRLILPAAVQDICMQRTQHPRPATEEVICCPPGSERQHRCYQQQHQHHHSQHDSHSHSHRLNATAPAIPWMQSLAELSFLEDLMVQLPDDQDTRASSQHTLAEGQAVPRSPPPAYSSILQNSDKPPPYDALFEERNKLEGASAVESLNNMEVIAAAACNRHHPPPSDSTVASDDQLVPEGVSTSGVEGTEPTRARVAAAAAAPSGGTSNPDSQQRTPERTPLSKDSALPSTTSVHNTNLTVEGGHSRRASHGSKLVVSADMD